MFKSYSSFEELTTSASRYLEDIGRQRQTLAIYNWIWKRIKLYMDKEKIEKCTSKAIIDYLTITYGDRPISQLSHHQKHCLRCALCLAQFVETGKMVEIIQRREVVSLEGEIGEQMNLYIIYKQRLRLNQKTLRAYSWYLFQFLKYLNGCGVFSMGLLSPLMIMKYATNLLPQAIGARHLALSIIRNFLRYLYDERKTLKDLSLIVPRDNYKKQPHLPSVYTRDEVQTILGSIDRSHSTGKRDYAMLMLAVRVGMRASDISSLEFKHLLWSENVISFEQVKTKEVVELPLPADVGESIIDYIKYARPVCSERSVFLEKLFPHHPISSKTVSKIATRTIIGSGVQVGERKHGSHALRHTMASLLLEQGTPLPIISELLGHTSIQTSMCYLRIDTESLRQCALEIPPVPEEFYTQKGGAFYE